MPLKKYLEQRTVNFGFAYCTVPDKLSILPPQKGLIEELEKIPSVAEVWIFSGTAHNLHIISISGRKQINLRTWLYVKLYSTVHTHISCFDPPVKKIRLLKHRLHYSFILL